MTFLMAMHRANGAGNVFYSAAPDDVHSILGIRYSHPFAGPDAFPAVAPEPFLEALRAQSGMQQLRCERVEAVDGASSSWEDLAPVLTPSALEDALLAYGWLWSHGPPTTDGAPSPPQPGQCGATWARHRPREAPRDQMGHRALKGQRGSGRIRVPALVVPARCALTLPLTLSWGQFGFEYKTFSCTLGKH